jgi:hypothetical protein
MVALALGKTEDSAEYDKDIKRVGDALNKYSWDEECGYYSYVLHDENYEPTEIFRTKTGENVNKGLDGIYPIIAGVCDENQKKKIIAHLTNDREMHTPFGISAVDMTASYYKINGYWNGNIWFPHQWFIWKSMLDCGEADFARDIAHLALNIWKREVESTYYTFEMVNTVTGLGGWFHNFGGLSTPLNMWMKAYYCPGTVNTGFDTWLDKTSFNENHTEAQIEFTHYGKNEKFCMLCVMNENSSYTAELDGEKIDAEAENGLLTFTFEIKNSKKHTLTIKAV